MKTRKLIIATAIGILAATPALAFVTGGINVDKLQQQPSVPQAEFIVTAKGDGQFEGNMWHRLSMAQTEDRAQRARGVAGRSGDDIDLRGSRSEFEGNMWERIPHSRH